jgi:hypothetical protein
LTDIGASARARELLKPSLPRVMLRWCR